MSRVLLPLAVVLLLIPPRSVLGQAGADLELAKRHFELARTYYDQADYEQALKAFKESYRLSKKAALLFNIGKCYEAMQQLHEAIEYYQRFLSESGKQDPNLAARIRNLRRRLAPKPEPKPDPSLRPTPPTSKPIEPSPPKQPEKPEETVKATVSGSSWMKWAGWGLAGTGVVSIATSVVLGIFATRKANAVEGYWADGDRDWAQVKTLEDQGEALEIAQIVTLAVGIAAAAGGTTLLILSWKKRRSQSVSIVPSVTPTGVGVVGAVRF